MDENTQATSAETTVNEDSNDWSDVTIEDADVVSDEGFDPTEEETETADPTKADADPQEQTDGQTDTDKEEPEQAKETDRFTLKHLDEVKNVSRDEVVALAQKGMDYDRIRQKYDETNAEHKALSAFCANPKDTLALLSELALEQGHPNIDAFVDEARAAVLAEKQGLDPALARGQIALERREKALTEKETKLLMQDGAAAAEAGAKEKQARDFAEFIGEYPELKPDSVPKEVWAIYGQGGRSLVQAYEKHENKLLKVQLAADKKNAENKQRSTGSATTAGKSSKEDALDALWDSD